MHESVRVKTNVKKKIKLLTLGIALTILSVSLAAIYINTTNKDSIRVACIGDSITEGFNYPKDLENLLGANYTVGNFGFGGTTVSLNSQTPYINQSKFQEAKTFQPNIVIIMLGTNDAFESHHKDNTTFVDDYLTLIRELQALASKPEIWIVKPPPIFHNGTGLSTEFFETTVIPNIEKVAQQANLPIIDVYSALENHSDLFWDGVHPNSYGASLIASTIYDALTLPDGTYSILL